MGFSGTYITARASQPLTRLPALRPSAAKTGWSWQGPEGWQVVQIDRGPGGWDSPDLPTAWDGLLSGLVKQAGSPVLAASIEHSDGAQLLGLSPQAGRWGGWLNPGCITGRALPDDGPQQYWDENGTQHSEDTAAWEQREQAALDRLYAHAGPPGSASAPQAVIWAREAGLVPDPGAVATALDADTAFVEDALFQVLAALGIPDIPAWSL